MSEVIINLLEKWWKDNGKLNIADAKRRYRFEGKPFGNIPIKTEKKKKNKKVNSDEKLALGWRIFVVIMALMMFMSFAGSLIYYFVSAMSK